MICSVREDIYLLSFFIQCDNIAKDVVNIEVQMTPHTDAHWRDSARPVKFFIWDGRAAFPVVIFLMHMTLWTLGVTILLIIFFSILNRYGFTPIVFFRWLRNLIAGNYLLIGIFPI